jgi:transposase
MGYSKLKKVADAFDLSFLDRFQQERRRKVGRKGYLMSSYVKAWLLKHLLGIPSEAQLVGRLNGSAELRKLCNLEKAPSRTSFCRARKRFGLRGIDFLFSFLVEKAKEAGLTKGKLVAVDSTDFTAYCNGDKKLKDRSDKFARWGHSTTKGRVFGYKAHIACDVETELPLAIVVLPASRHDVIGFFPLFEKLLKFQLPYSEADCRLRL